MKPIIFAACALLALTACSPDSEKAPDPEAAKPIVPVTTNLPAGRYTLDKAHASLIFRVNHLGFSHYTARFKRFDATLDLDPANPTAAMLEVTVDPNSIETDFPDPEMLDFNATLRGPEWLDTAQFPTMTYRTNRIELVAPNTARITGDLTLHGVTKPVTLDAIFNGGYIGHPFDPNARIGFSATGVLKRSDFGIAYGIPEPGTTMGVSDDVHIILETEFTGPPMPQDAAAPSP